MRKARLIFIPALVIIAVCFSIAGSGSASSAIKVLVNGKELSSEAKVIDDRVYIQAREVTETLGAEVSWDNAQRVVNITMSGGDNLLPEVIKSVSPSVVGIIGNLKEESEFSTGKYSDQIVHGTGVVIKATGEILTNAHVVKEMGNIVVVISDGSGYEAKLKSIDEESDLAVIKINKPGLVPAKFATQEEIVIGRTVIAIGTPVSFSLRNSASIGIIGGINRSIDSYYRLIQTDAAINPGNSGGPLVNLKGEVIGINSTKFAGSGIEGLGFSIPIGTIEYVLSHFEKYGKVKRPKLGADFEEDWAAKVGLPSNSGLKVTNVKERSAANKSGLLVDDVILSVNGNNVNTLIDYNEVMKKFIPGDKTYFKVRRDGVITNINVVLEE